jgi:hypothetical protein
MTVSEKKDFESFAIVSNLLDEVWFSCARKTIIYGNPTTRFFQNNQSTFDGNLSPFA